MQRGVDGTASGTDPWVCPAPNQLAARLRPSVALQGTGPGFSKGSLKVDANGTVFSQVLAGLNSRVPGSSGRASIVVGGLPVRTQGGGINEVAAVDYATSR